MKLGRRFVVSAWLTMLVAVASFSGWWAKWPRQTAIKFSQLIAEGRFDDANQYFDPPDRWTSTHTGNQLYISLDDGQGKGGRRVAAWWQKAFTPNRIWFGKRKTVQFLLGEQSFTFDHGEGLGPYFFTARHGKIDVYYDDGEDY
jgi:hypothetical protein